MTVEIVKIPKEWGLREPRVPVDKRVGRHGKSFDELFDWDNLFIGVTRVAPNQIVCVGPPLYEMQSRLNFNDGKNQLEFKVANQDRTSTVFIFSESDELYLGDIKLNVNQRCTKFEGRKILMTKQKNEPLEWIRQWVHYHYSEYGITGFVIYNNNCTDYTIQETYDYLSDISDEIIIDVQDYAVPFGPGGPYWVSDFCIYMLNEHFKYNYSINAQCALYHDIDELLVLAEHITIDDIVNYLLQNNKTGIEYGNFNVDPRHIVSGKDAYDMDRDDIRYLDFVHQGPHINRDQMQGPWCIIKWLCIPNKSLAYQWSTHSLGGDVVVAPKTEREIYFAHYFSHKSVNKDRDVEEAKAPINISRAKDGDLIKDTLLEKRLTRAFKNYFTS